MKNLETLQTEAREKFDDAVIRPYTIEDLTAIHSFIDAVIASAYQLGKDASVEFLQTQSTSYVAQGPECEIHYDVPDSLLTQARSAD